MTVRNTWLVGLLFVAAACGEAMEDGGAADVAGGAVTANLSGTQVFGTVVEMTADATLYAAADYHSTVKRSLAKGTRGRIVRTTSSNGYYNIRVGSKVGWAAGAYMKAVSVPNTSDEHATARAYSAVGFSYYWGGEQWNPTTESWGSCTGSCPDCDHSGSWGADCSGLITKAWKVGSSCSALTDSCSSRPTAAGFRVTDPNGKWKNISRDSIAEGDVMASTTHVVYYLSGDAWNTPTVIECKGCADGCVKNARSFSSTYRTSRRIW